MDPVENPKINPCIHGPAISQSCPDNSEGKKSLYKMALEQLNFNTF